MIKRAGTPRKTKLCALASPPVRQSGSKHSRAINPQSPSEGLTSFLTLLLLLFLLFLQEYVVGFAGVSLTTGSAERAAPLGASPSSSAHGGLRRCGAQMMITALPCMLRTSLPLLERQRQILPTKSPCTPSLSLVSPLSLSLCTSRCLSFPFLHYIPPSFSHFPSLSAAPLSLPLLIQSNATLTHDSCQFHKLCIPWIIPVVLRVRVVPLENIFVPNLMHRATQFPLTFL